MQALPDHLGGLPAAAALEASLEGYHSHSHHQHHNLPFLPPQFLQQGLHGYHFADGDIGSQLADWAVGRQLAPVVHQEDD